MNRWNAVLFAMLFVMSSFGQELSKPVMALYSTTNAAQQEVAWSTRPGIRYVLQESADLQSWSTVDGFPSEASALAQQHVIELAGASNAFFRVQALDEQPPKMTSLIPADGSFAVRRFSSITVLLDDAFGIDTNSISLTVGTNDAYSVGSTELSWSTNSFVFDLGGDTALGMYGATVDVSLVVGDILGNSTNYIWSFELEKEIEEAENLFVFGSPDAQRAGQNLNGEAAVLAARYSSGPIRMSGTSSDWEIDSVSSNSIVLTYTSSNAPIFTVGQPLANKAPAHVDEIFYRIIDSLNDDVVNKKLTLFTSEIMLADVMVNGSFSIGEDSVFLEFDENGDLVKSLSGDATFELPTIGSDLSGKTLLKDGSFSFSLEEAKFLFHPKLKISVETKWMKLERFEAEARGDLEISCVLLAEASGAWKKSDSKVLWDWSYWVGAGYVYVELNSSITANASVAVDASAELRGGFRENVNVGVKGKYIKEGDPAVSWKKWNTPSPLEEVPLTPKLNVKGSASVSLVSQIDIRLYGAAGLYINTDPRFELSGSATMVNTEVTEADWLLGAYADVNAGLSVIGLENDDLPALDPLRIFTKEWRWPRVDTNAPPVTVAVQPVSQNAGYGDTVTFFVEAFGGTGEYGFQWYQNGKLLPGATGDELRLLLVSLGHEGDYVVKITSNGQQIDSNTAFLRVLNDGSTGFPLSGMVRIPGGTNSGTNPLAEGELYERYYDFYYPETYSLSVDSFYMDRSEVTKQQWDKVFDWAILNGYTFRHSVAGAGANYPVYDVDWHDAVKWCNARSEMERLMPCYTSDGSVYRNQNVNYNDPQLDCDFDACGYRLPTSEEWEYAARGGLKSKRFPWGDSISYHDANYSTCDINGGIGTYYISYDLGPEQYGVKRSSTFMPVCSYLPNRYGLYDVIGNVDEWCWDEGVVGWVRRGGSFSAYNIFFRGAQSLRCGFKGSRNDILQCPVGFRAVRSR